LSNMSGSRSSVSERSLIACAVSPMSRKVRSTSPADLE
jgi:hypothetical protein